jgi:1-acyl-sn-glycerol-3-phosphate acyltransferase
MQGTLVRDTPEAPPVKKPSFMDKVWTSLPNWFLEGMRKPFGQALAWVARTLSGVRERWECQPTLKQRLYYFNHSSHADTVLLWACLPPEVRDKTRFVAAEDYWSQTAVRRYFAQKVFNAIFVSRTATDAQERAEQIDRIVEGMGTEYSVLFAPEGTRGDGEEVQPFKSGLYHLCKARPNLELVPVFLENLSRLLPKGESLPCPLLCRVSFGAPVYLQPGEQRQEFLDRARKALVDLGQE